MSEKTANGRRLLNAAGAVPRGPTRMALVMLFFARIEFNADLASMNTLSKETVEAEQALQKVWGDMSAKPCLIVRGRTVEDVLIQADRLAMFMNRERHSSVLDQNPPRSMLLPGPRTQAMNLKAWNDFWTPERMLDLERSLREASAKLGFKHDAFEPFVKLLHQPMQRPSTFPQEFLAAFGVFPEGEKDGWVLVDTIVPGPNCDSFLFFEQARQQGFLFFDARHFSSHLAAELNRSFVGILLIVMVVTVLSLFLVFLDWQLLLLSIAPVTFSLIATLGTMGLLGHSLSIPSLMLAPLLVGLGLEPLAAQVFPKIPGVIQDMIQIIQRRFENVRLLLYPARVQGEGAAGEIAEGIRYLNKRGNVDVFIVGRGGGSLEDLWAFNEERWQGQSFNRKYPSSLPSAMRPITRSQILSPTSGRPHPLLRQSWWSEIRER